MSGEEINPACNFPNLANLSTNLMAYRRANGDRVQNKMQRFLETYNETTYNELKEIIAEALSQLRTGENESLRVLLSIDDGTVAIDTSKAKDDNTFSNFNVNTINSANHNTRPEIMVATLGNSGVGVSERYSKSVGRFQKYQANRIGGYAQSNLGTLRVSLDKTKDSSGSSYETLW